MVNLVEVVGHLDGLSEEDKLHSSVAAALQIRVMTWLVRVEGN